MLSVLAIVGVFVLTWLLLTVLRYHQAQCVMVAFGAALVSSGIWTASQFGVLPGLVLIAVGCKTMFAFFPGKTVTWRDVFPPSEGEL